MRRFTVLGFTEAELGFVLAALFAALAAGYINRGEENKAEATRLASEVDSLKNERDRLAGALSQLEDSLNKIPVVKTSTKVPNCWEKGESRDPIAEVQILGDDLFALHGERLDLAALRESVIAG